MQVSRIVIENKKLMISKSCGEGLRLMISDKIPQLENAQPPIDATEDEMVTEFRLKQSEKAA
jgi:hypothetical protein